MEKRRFFIGLLFAMLCLIGISRVHGQDNIHQVVLPFVMNEYSTITETPTEITDTPTATPGLTDAPPPSDTYTSTPTPSPTNTPTPTDTPTATNTPTATSTPTNSPTPPPPPRTCPLAGAWAGDRGRRIAFAVSDDPDCEINALTLRSELTCNNGGSVSQRTTFLRPIPIANKHFSFDSTTTDVSGDFPSDEAANGNWSSQYTNPFGGYTCSGSGSWQGELVPIAPDALLIDQSFLGGQALVAADLDGDDDMDLLGGGDFDGVVWWENQANSSFAKHVVSVDEQFYDAYSVQPIDMDGDHDVDVLSAAEFGDTAWWENDGTQNYVKHALGSFSWAHSAFGIDLDDDGDMDILLGDTASDRVLWFENDGAQNFTEHTVADQLPEPQSVRAADLDGDGDLDIIAAASNLVAGKLLWWENDGNQSFIEHVLSGSYLGAAAIDIADVNQDGRMDILSAASEQNDVTWWQNDGTGNFTPHSLASDFAGAKSVVATDMDGDQDIDIVAAAYEADTIALWENDGNSNFSKRVVSSNFYGAQVAYVADINGDGAMEFLGVSALLNMVAAWPADPAQRLAVMISTASTNYLPSHDHGYVMDVWGAGDTSFNGQLSAPKVRITD